MGIAKGADIFDILWRLKTYSLIWTNSPVPLKTSVGNFLLIKDHFCNWNFDVVLCVRIRTVQSLLRTLYFWKILVSQYKILNNLTERFSVKICKGLFEPREICIFFPKFFLEWFFKTRWIYFWKHCRKCFPQKERKWELSNSVQIFFLQKISKEYKARTSKCWLSELTFSQ